MLGDFVSKAWQSAHMSIPASVVALFPKSARQLLVDKAWHPDRAKLDRPQPNGSDGWSSKGIPPTRENLERLAAQGYTHVNITASGVADNFKDASIAGLLGHA